MLTGNESPDVHPEDTLCEMGHINTKKRLAIQTVNQLLHL